LEQRDAANQQVINLPLIEQLEQARDGLKQSVSAHCSSTRVFEVKNNRVSDDIAYMNAIGDYCFHSDSISSDPGSGNSDRRAQR